MGVFHNARTGGGFGFGGALPFVTAGDAFPFFGVVENIGHFAHRAGWVAHERAA